MATIVTINGSDLPSNSRADINTNFSNLNSDKIETSYLDTDTALTADSDTKIATQKAVKAYVDAGGNVNASTSAKGIVEEATQAEVDAGTAEGGTGARLFINPSTQATGVIKSVTAGATINGATLPVPVYQNKTDNEFYACDANDTAAYKFLGFAVTNGTDGAAMTVKFSGIVSGFTGLAEGEKYYVQDTVGTIGTSPGTQEILVGIAISTTELLIQKGKRFASGEFQSTATATNHAIVCGFRPSRVIVHGIYNDESGGTILASTMHIVWTPGGQSSFGTFISAAGQAPVSEPRLYTSTGDYMEYGVASITDTGFTITENEAGTFTGNAQNQVVWTAEGEL